METKFYRWIAPVYDVCSATYILCKGKPFSISNRGVSQVRQHATGAWPASSKISVKVGGARWGGATPGGELPCFVHALIHLPKTH